MVGGDSIVFAFHIHTPRVGVAGEVMQKRRSVQHCLKRERNGWGLTQLDWSELPKLQGN